MIGRTTLTIILIACEVLVGCWAARKVDAHLRARETMHRRRSKEIVFQRRDETPLDTTELFQLTEGENLEDVRETTDAVGTKLERLQETYKGIEVYDAIVTVRKTKDGQLTGDATGIIYQGIDEDLPNTEPEISNEETLRIVLNAEGDNLNDVGDVRYHRMVYIDKSSRARLVNIVTYLVDGYKRPNYIIDVKNGHIIKHWQGLNTYPCCERTYKAWGGNEKMGRITYGDMPHCLAPTIVGEKCYLENEYVRVVDMLHSEFENITETASFDCEKGYGDNVNGAYSPAIDAFFYGTVVGKMFEEWFNSSALKEKIVIRVHFGEMYENAFWNGVNTTFGDGGDDLYPLVSLDVVGHEIGHGVVERYSKLEYFGESGGINEAFADIFGEAPEDYLLDADFLTGNTIMKHRPYMREFERPENDNMSISHVRDMTEYTDPHFSSGVYRRIWYVVTKEEGMSIRDAAAVFLYANMMFWHSTASFYDCSCGTLKAALDLGHNTEPFRKAFKDVGLEECDITSHVFGMNNNETRTGIIVSQTTNPIFKMKTPEWADNFYVKVSRSSIEKKRDTVDISGDEILITVMTNGWEITDDECTSAKLVAEGLNHVILPDVGENEFFFKLSVSAEVVIQEDETLANSTIPLDINSYQVDITAGYSCIVNDNSTSSFNWHYNEDCGIERSWR